MIHNILYTAITPRESEMGLQAQCTCLRFRAQTFGQRVTMNEPSATADRMFRLIHTAEQHRTEAIAAEVRASILATLEASAS